MAAVEGSADLHVGLAALANAGLPPHLPPLGRLPRARTPQSDDDTKPDRRPGQGEGAAAEAAEGGRAGAEEEAGTGREAGKKGDGREEERGAEETG